jgi:uncharacterized protein (TIRG00374 family)
MSENSSKVTELFTAKKIAIPIVIGLLVSGYLLWKNTDWDQFQNIDWNVEFFFWMFVALLMMACRDFGYMYRIRVLTHNKISWRHSFDVIMLWEFVSAVTPSVVGGTGAALYIINKEGISAGKSTAIVMITAFFDELFYVLTVPLVLIFIGTSNLFPVELQKKIFGITFSTEGLFWVGYGFMFLLLSIITYGILLNPKGFKAIILNVFKLKFLRKWRYSAIQVGDDIILTSKQMKKESMWFWIKAFVATFLGWTARFWVVNFLILAFVSVDDHLLIYGRQLVMWVIMLISPTPGGAGIAEFAFNGFLKDFIPIGLAGLLAVLWRLISYYPYLFIGIFVLPNWLKRVYHK